jgi:parallel beta-helix repeat protein
MAPNNKKIITIFAAFLCMLFLTEFELNSFDLNNEDLIQDEEIIITDKLKNSGFWTESFIHVDNNWSNTESTYTWCSGSGTSGDPYIIENVTINALNQGTGILIENSNEYFIISNVSVYNSSVNGAGIKTIDAENGQIINSNFSFNGGSGIELGYTGGASKENITISGNTITNNSRDGITLDGWHTLYNITNNYIYGNSLGINFSTGFNSYTSIRVKQNTIFKNRKHGIGINIVDFSEINDNNITGNGFTGNYDGIYIFSSSADGIIFKNNTISNNNRYGLAIETNNEWHEIYNNRFIGNGIHAKDDSANNIWDKFSIGNYWDNYTGRDIDDDGVGDSPHIVPGSAGEQDNYPIWDDGINFLYIDASATGVGAHNWTWAVSQPWCTGSGTSGDPYVIEDLIINAYEYNSCILIEYSSVYFRIENCTLYNSSASGAGIKIHDSDNGKLMYNNFSFNAGSGIEVTQSSFPIPENFTIAGNLIMNNSGDGISFDQAEDNNIKDNYIYGNLRGIDFEAAGSNYNVLVERNTIYRNKEHGIDISQLGTATFNGNNITGNGYTGSFDGIFLSNNNDYVYVMNNTISDNNRYGIYVRDSGFNNNHEFYNNSFIGNGAHARDDDPSTNNDWDHWTGIGNYWDNYTGVDADDDGIGDTPHTIPGVGGYQDMYPIWDDGINGIYIDDSATGVGAHNWTWALQQDWCSGSGTSGDPYLIGNLTINALNQGAGIFIENSNEYFIISNVTVYGSSADGAGIKINETQNGQIINSNVSFNAGSGIEIFQTANKENITISGNTIKNNTEDGISFEAYCNDYNILNNYISGNTIGIKFNGSIPYEYSVFNITGNIIYKNKQHGLYLDYIDLSTIAGNNITYNGYTGSYDGIYFIRNTDTFYVWNNTISENTQYGIEITSSINQWHNFYNNSFINNGGGNAINNDNNNDWDYAGVGNYWDDYSGVDVDDDGVGDTPYIVSGIGSPSQDDFPNWWDPPVISVQSPLPNEGFGGIAPNFSITIDEGINDTMWYTLDNGNTNTTFVMDGSINQTIWDSFGDGLITIQFYVNDSKGYIGYSEVNIIKDTDFPIIVIDTPLPNQLYGSLPPSFNLTIIEGNLNSTWYTLVGYTNNRTFVGNGTINLSDWSSALNGTVTIRFYVNDTAGNLNFTEVTVRKDIDPPDLTIDSPFLNQLFGPNAPSFNLTIVGIDLNTTWYMLVGYTNNRTFIGNGTINLSDWSSALNGTVTIRFYVNDTFGNINFSQVTVRKDIDPPDITIDSPFTNQLFGSNTPGFNLTIIGSDLNTTWYMLVGYTNNRTFVGNGTINLSDWNSALNGTVTIRFYANDSFGNLNFTEVTVRKDIDPPDITTNSPIPYELFGTNSPNFTLTFIGGDVNTTWYTIDNEVTNYTFTGLSGKINQTAWNGMINGTVTIRFYINDTMGNINYTEVIVRNDIDAPSINILNPIPFKAFGQSAPTFNLDITEANLNITWYRLWNGTVLTSNQTFVYGVDTLINQSIWNQVGNGTVIIQFYANDTMGNIAYSNRTVQKDIYVPLITIQEPSVNKLFGKSPPNFQITTSGSNLIAYWYRLEGTVITGNYTYMDSTQGIKSDIINQTLWNQVGNSTVTIRFYLNKTGGLMDIKTITIRKDIIGPNITIISPNPNDLFGNTTLDFTISITEANLNFTWYTIDNGATNYTFIGLSGTINQTAWTGRANGTVIIRFYSNDTMGNLNFTDVVLRKDSIRPSILLSNPTPNKKYTDEIPSLTVEISLEPHLNSTWYTLDDGSQIVAVIISQASWNLQGSNIIIIEEINQTLWNELPDGTITIRFYANDTLGNLRYKVVSIIKESAQQPGDNIIIIIIFIIIISAAVSGGLVIQRKSKKKSIELKQKSLKIMEKESQIIALEKQRAELTEDDITISKERHICLVHKGTIEGYSFICPGCGAFYCQVCLEAIKKIENVCWSCGNSLDPSKPSKKEELIKEISDKDIEMEDKPKKGPKKEWYEY